MADTVTCITNQTRSLHHLPPIPGDGRWPEGIKLIPGLNRVPTAYLEAYREYSVQVADSGGRPLFKDELEETLDAKGKAVTVKVKVPVVRYPGRDELARLTTKPRKLVSMDKGNFVGTTLIIHPEGEIDPSVPDGPKPPAMLPENEALARKLVSDMTSKAVLTGWFLNEQRPEIQKELREAIQNAKEA